MMTIFKSALLFLLVGGLISCSNNKQGEVAEASEPKQPAQASTAGNAFSLDLDNSTILWEGYKPGKTHSGTIKLKDGTFSMKDGTLEGGKFVIDMASIEVTDLEPGKGKENLEGHLRGTADGKETDFFNVREHPTGSFEITKVAKLQGDEQANHMIYGNLTLKGISKQVAFKANVEANENQFKAESLPFRINRTEWDIKFMSKNFFENLGDNFINDEIGLIVSIMGQAS